MQYMLPVIYIYSKVVLNPCFIENVSRETLFLRKNFALFSTRFSFYEKKPILDFEKIGQNVSRETLLKLFTVEKRKKKCYNGKAQ